MKIKRERYFSIHSTNQPGELFRVTAQLMESKVDCSGVWGFGTTHKNAEIICVPRDDQKFKEVAKQVNWSYTEGICFHLEGKDKTGALVDILNQLSKDGINLQALDAIAVEGNFGCYLWVPDNELEHVAQILGLSTPKP